MELILAKELELARSLAIDAGELLLQARRDGLKVHSKSASRDLVTQADKASEALILNGLNRVFPEDSFLAEESGYSGPESASGRQWCVDPLDGTVNFVQGLPMYAVSIALLSEGQAILGVVYLPELDQCFSAYRGGGAFLNEEQIFVSDKKNLQDSVLATGFPYRRHLLADNNLENFNRMFLQQRGIRRMGAAAVDLAYVAAGKLDAFWELHLSPWDCAAGSILVSEAGGQVDTFQGGGNPLFERNIIAGPASLLSQIRDCLLTDRGNDYPPLGDIEGTSD